MEPRRLSDSRDVSFDYSTDASLSAAWTRVRALESETSILRSQLDDANAKIASLEAINAEIEGSNDALRAALVEAIGIVERRIQDETGYEVNDDVPDWERAQELRKLDDPPPPGMIRVTFTVPEKARYTMRLTWTEPA